MGVFVSPQNIQATQAIVRTELSHSSWAFAPHGEGMQKGQAFFHRILTLAEAETETTGLKEAADYLWDRHLEDNLWSQLLPGAVESLSVLKGAGMRLAVISNAEGTIDALLQSLGLRDSFEFVLDSTVVGIAKPDPRIFKLALDRFGLPENRVVMVGDSLAADVHGAWSAGIAAALIDPLNLHPTCAAPRFDDLLAFAKALIPAK